MFKKIKRNLILLPTIIFPVILSGCLNFGKSEETTSPTPGQISRCYSEMYLCPDLKIQPLGYKTEESGIDNSIWFKFETNAAISKIFKSTVVDTTRFIQNFSLFYETKGPKWWDVKGKSLSGGQIELPNGRYMNIGIEKTKKEHIVYIMWYET